MMSQEEQDLLIEATVEMLQKLTDKIKEFEIRIQKLENK